jgi:hypothetical protein
MDSEYIGICAPFMNAHDPKAACGLRGVGILSVGLRAGARLVGKPLICVVLILWPVTSPTIPLRWVSFT